MDKKTKSSTITSKENPQIQQTLTFSKNPDIQLQSIKRYPFNGRSNYLIDRFYIMGYDSKTLHKYVIEKDNENLALSSTNSISTLTHSGSIGNILKVTEKKKIKQSMIIEPQPTILSEFTSDYKKIFPDKDLIKDMIFPNNVEFFYTTEKDKNLSSFDKTSSAEYKFISDKITSERFSKLSNHEEETLILEDEFSIFSEEEQKIVEPYNVVFSYNPQYGNNSKKSINGFAHVFYKKYKETKNIGDKILTYYVPNAFVIISEYPFYDSFNNLCKQILKLFSEQKIEIPIELIIYNIVNFTLSPLNGDVFLTIEPQEIMFDKIIISEFDGEQIKNRLNREYTIKEVDEKYEEYYSELNPENSQIQNNNNNQKTEKNEKNEKIKQIVNKKKDSKEKRAIAFTAKKPNNKNSKFSNKNIHTNLTLNHMKKSNTEENLLEAAKKNVRGTVYNKNPQKNNKKINRDRSSDLRTLDDIVKSKNTILPKFKRGSEVIENEENTSKELTKTSSCGPSSLISSNTNFKYSEIKFNFLPGYPIIQYNLLKVLFYTMSPEQVIKIFFTTFLEKDVVFFSKNIEYLSLTINAYLNLNYPLNDEKYYFFNACVSYNNYINNNSPFVGSTFTTVLGVNCTFPNDYRNTNMAKSKEHLCVDLDNKEIYLIGSNNNNSNYNIVLDLIKRICRSREIKEEEKDIILCREIKVIFEDLLYFLSEKSYKKYLLFPFMTYSERDEKCIFANTKSIKDINIEIQESFYRLINNLCLYFYQNLNLKDKTQTQTIQKPIVQKERTATQESIDSLGTFRLKTIDTNSMDIIYLKDYDNNKNGEEKSKYIKEEISFLEELTETMKFESFVYGFIQSYNPIDLYKIPLTISEEFISILSRKNKLVQDKDKKINFFSIIDYLYKKSNQKKTKIDFNDFYSEFYKKKYKTVFDRHILDSNSKIDKSSFYINNSNNLLIRVNFGNSNEGKIFDSITYKSFELDKNIVLKYKKILNNLSKEEFNKYFPSQNLIEQNIIKDIFVSEIESEIEKYSIEIKLLSSNNVCCSIILFLFIISLKTILNQMDCQSFLISFFNNFIVFRKYYTIVMNTIYTLLKQSLSAKDYTQSQKYLFCYYPCINSIRNHKLVPNENLMKIIKKFNQIDINAIMEKIDGNKSDIIINNKNENIKISDEFVYVKNNFNKNNFIKESEIVEMANNIKTSDTEKSVLKFKYKIGNSRKEKIVQPKIVFNNGLFSFECNIFPLTRVLEVLNQEYQIFSLHSLNENFLSIEKILEACLNIYIFMRNSEVFTNMEDIADSVNLIINIYLNRLNQQKNSSNLK